MILRNVTVAAERERLRGPRTPELTPVPPPAQGHKPIVEVLVAPPAPPPLDVETVCAWLQTQPAEVRAICATSLAGDLQALREGAVEAGLEMGRAQAHAEVLESARSAVAALSRTASGCEQAFAHECAQLAESCADIVAEAFRKLAGPTLVTREAALGMVLEVLKRAKDERGLTIRVSPQDLSFLESQTSAIQEALGTRSWTLAPDARVALGGCLVESSLGTLDGRLELQLKDLWETLRAAKSARPEEP